MSSHSFPLPSQRDADFRKLQTHLRLPEFDRTTGSGKE
jgi:hypothetical protein